MRNYRQEYERYHKKPAQKKKRASRNTARRRMTKDGRVTKGDGRDIDHKDGNPRNNSRTNLRVQSRSQNRSVPRTRSARKKRA